MPDSKTVLYIEDNPDNRLLVRRILHASGYRLLEAEHASKALEILQNETPDLILMDINMPEMDGYTLTAKLRRFPHLTTVPVIALTANVMKGDRERTLEAGCDGYIQKPVDVDTFPEQIAKYIKR
ncbi:MAG: response regulator [Anaerolineales bacterium]|nr:response regulator [Anaerolineales bacterium]